jgi:hypothetical protein
VPFLLQPLRQLDRGGHPWQGILFAKKTALQDFLVLARIDQRIDNPVSALGNILPAVDTATHAFFSSRAGDVVFSCDVWTMNSCANLLCDTEQQILRSAEVVKMAS